jgi:hypothetical protein
VLLKFNVALLVICAVPAVALSLNSRSLPLMMIALAGGACVEEQHGETVVVGDRRRASACRAGILENRPCRDVERLRVGGVVGNAGAGHNQEIVRGNRISGRVVGRRGESDCAEID